MTTTPSCDTSAADVVVQLARRPPVGAPLDRSVFHIVERSSKPASDGDPASLPPNAIQVKMTWLSVDPMLRCRFNESTGVEYVGPYEVGAPISSPGVGVVVKSTLSGNSDASLLQEGDLVHGLDMPWATTFVAVRPNADAAARPSASITGAFPRPIPKRLVAAVGADTAAKMTLSVVGITGLTAYFAIDEAFGAPLRQMQANPPTADERDGGGVAVVVSSVAGATGSVFAALCKTIPGVTVIGITSTRAKAATVAQLGIADAVLAYRDDVARADEDAVGPTSLTGKLLEAAGSKPIVAFLDCVGGWISTQVFRAMREGARVVLCGQIATYNDDVPYPPPLSAAASRALSASKLRRERYLVLTYMSRLDEAQEQIADLVARQRVPLLATVYDGLAKAPDAMIDLMDGANVGKMLVRLA